MPSNYFTQARYNMLTNQLRPCDIRDARILDAMGTIPREHFVPENLKSVAYLDRELPLIEGRYLLSPAIFARMLSYAAPQKEHTVLDIGCASGYSAAVLSRLVKKVVAVEESTALLTKAKSTLSSLKANNVTLVGQPHAQGCTTHAPYDCIFLQGEAFDIPQTLIDQLKEDGMLVGVFAASSREVPRIVAYQKHKNVLYAKNTHDGFAHPIPGFVPPSSNVFRLT